MRGECVVQLHGDDEGDAPVGADHAEQSAEGVEGLGDEDASLDRGVDVAGDVGFEELIFESAGPTEVEGEAEQKNVEPVDKEGGAVGGELGEQCSREGNQRDDAEEGDVDPGEAAVGAFEMVELRLLSDPEDAEGEDAHGEHQQARGEREECVGEVAFAVDGFRGGDLEVEDEQGHGDGEDAVAEGGEAFGALSGDAVVVEGHLGSDRSDFTW